MGTVRIVESHLGGIYLSTDDVGDIEVPCPSCGDCDIVIGEYDQDGDADDIAMGVCDALRDEYGTDWLPGEGDLSGYVWDMLACMGDFVDDCMDDDGSVTGVSGGWSFDSRVIGAIVSDSCRHLAGAFASTDGPRVVEVCERIVGTVPLEMLGRLRAQGVACDGSVADDAAISSTAMRRLRELCAARADGLSGEQRVANAVGGNWRVIDGVMRGDGAWARRSSVAARLRDDLRDGFGGICEDAGTTWDAVLARVADSWHCGRRRR